MPDIFCAGSVARRIFESAQKGSAFHAYLVTGPKGSGKSRFAMEAGAALLCSEKGKPCGGCASCKMAYSKHHPDFLLIAPDDAGSIRIKQVRFLLEELSRCAFYGGWRAIAIARAETMTSEAQNCLLKTLEEPPQKTCFFLLAASYEVMLPTIRSRCVHVRMEAMDEGALVQLLIKEGADENEARQIARISGGVPGAALELLADKKGDGRLWSVRKGMLELILSFKGLPSLPAAQNHFRSIREDAEFALSCMASFCRDMLMIKAGCEALAENIDALPRLSRTSETFTKGQLGDIIDLILQAKKQLAANVNYALAVDMLFISASEVLI